MSACRYGWVSLIVCGLPALAFSQPAQQPGQAVPAQMRVLRPALRVVGGSAEQTEPQQSATATPPANATQNPAAAAATTARLAKIKALKFDRRPSAILKAWATPPKAPDAESEATPEAKPEPATTAKPAPEQPAAAAAQAAAAKRAAEQLRAFEAQLTTLQRNVTLGRWEAVGTFVSGLPEAEAKALYAQLLKSLVTRPAPRNPRMVAYAEANVFSPDDIVAIAGLCPGELETVQETQLAGLIGQALKSEATLESMMDRFRQLRDAPAESPLSTRQIARILMVANLPVEAGEFLPDVPTATKEDDREALNLLSRHLLARHAKEKDTKYLEQAWDVTQAALAAGDIDEKQKQEALSRAVELAPQIREELGQGWLEESFTQRPERGMEILATAGEVVAAAMETHPTDADFRLRSLRLQDTAVDALLAAAPERAREWQGTLLLLATNWLREAELSHQFDQSTRRGPQMQRDMYGNYFWNNNARSTNSASSRRPTPIDIGSLLEIVPDDAWMDLLPGAVRPPFAMVLPQLLLKVQEEEQAFPHIERLAATHPEIAKQLVEEFLRVWIQNHDPNAARNRTNLYMFSYGFNQRANGIPLTRSKQDRNLQELSAWLERIRRLPIDDLDEALLTRAFRAVHSQAEVYRLDAMERVFGGVDTLRPETLAELIQNMRANLMTVWRAPDVQKQAGTNRRRKDIEAEVRRGYKVAGEVLDEALRKYPDHWSILLARAAIAHDQNIYENELARSSEFAARRDRAFADFRRAAQVYAKAAEAMKPEEYSTQVFDLWFYASLGACDIGQIDGEKPADPKQPPLIREVLNSMPSELAEQHLAMFANTLFTRLSSVSPAVKFRFLKAGLEIVGDHKRAEEARKVFEYYRDLVTEIKLEAVIDGPDVVGHSEPFGIFVNLRHTTQIERESGGFAKYLQNQNNMYYSYNYGRPTENYRDKFEETVQQSLNEHFEVLSVTFQQDSVTSRATAVPGWRVTPYAYLLVRARGPEVDRVPSVRLDLDFLDTSGYAVIPVETPVVPIDARPVLAADRPVKNLQVTQTLDERQAGDGRLVLEIKATGRGLIPPLEQILDVSPAEFEVVSVEDQGVSVSRFDPDSDENAVTSDRTWLVTMQAKPGLAQAPTRFQFAACRVPESSVMFQRYVDADLASVGRQIELEERYPVEDSRLATIAMIGLPLLALAAGLVWFMRRPRAEREVSGYQLPEQLTPFTVLGLLKDIERTNGLNPDGRQELAASIHRLEDYYFSEASGDEPDLVGIATTWVRKAR